jgi:hypothetical protein
LRSRNCPAASDSCGPVVNRTSAFREDDGDCRPLSPRPQRTLSSKPRHTKQRNPTSPSGGFNQKAATVADPQIARRFLAGGSSLIWMALSPIIPVLPSGLPARGETR